MSFVGQSRRGAALAGGTLSERVGVDVAALGDWMDGVARPSQGEFTRLFRALKRPSALFFAPSAPEPSSVPALRGSPGRVGRALSEQERLWVRRSRRLQALMRFLLQKKGRRIDLPRFRREVEAEIAGGRVRQWLGASVDLQMSWDSSVDPWRWWRAKLERCGTLVFALQLGPEGVRGFSFSDDVAPCHRPQQSRPG